MVVVVSQQRNLRVFYPLPTVRARGTLVTKRPPNCIANRNMTTVSSISTCWDRPNRSKMHVATINSNDIGSLINKILRV